MSFFALRYWKSMFFDENSISGIKAFASWKFGIIYFILVVLFQSLPLTKEELFTFPFDYLNVFWKFGIVLLSTFILAKLLGSKENFKRYLYTVSTVNLFGAFLTAILAYLSLFIFELLLDNAVISNFVTSFLPYYIIVLFAFTAETAVNLQSWKSVLVGVFGTIALYCAYFFL